MYLSRNTQYGFTLVEMIVVMVITGIIGGMVAIFIRAPVQGYMDSSRRAEMTDIADTALRRLARDIRTAVPNSVRVPNPGGTSTYIEFLPTRDGGRYRAEQDCTAACVGDVLEFGAALGSFDIIGSQINFSAGDHIVIGSTQSDGNPPYNTANTGVLRAHDDAMLGLRATVNFSTTTALPVWAEVQGQRFDVVPGDQQAVTYACVATAGAVAAGDGPLTLMRYWGYGFRANQLPPPATVGAATAGSIGAVANSAAILADNVSACEIIYGAVNQRNGLVAIRLGITRGGENISLYHTIHVNNVP
jgi:MSHA biogenesis protein MshO